MTKKYSARLMTHQFLCYMENDVIIVHWLVTAATKKTDLFSLLFGENTMLVRNLRSWDSHVLENELSYDDYRVQS